MFVTYGRFKFRAMDDAEFTGIIDRIGADVPPIARGCSGFRGVYFATSGERELMTVWMWDNAADWDAAAPKFGPALGEYVVPNLTEPPERIGGDVVVEVTP